MEDTQEVFLIGLHCVIITNGIKYNGKIISYDKYSLKFLYDDGKTKEIIFILNPYKNIMTVHYEGKSYLEYTNSRDQVPQKENVVKPKPQQRQPKPNPQKQQVREEEDDFDYYAVAADPTKVEIIEEENDDSSFDEIVKKSAQVAKQKKQGEITNLKQTMTKPFRGKDYSQTYKNPWEK